eukprot:3632618-Amphidinium_carterae.1
MGGHAQHVMDPLLHGSITRLPCRFSVFCLLSGECVSCVYFTSMCAAHVLRSCIACDPALESSSAYLAFACPLPTCSAFSLVPACMESLDHMRRDHPSVALYAQSQRDWRHSSYGSKQWHEHPLSCTAISRTLPADAEACNGVLRSEAQQDPVPHSNCFSLQ